MILLNNLLGLLSNIVNLSPERKIVAERFGSAAAAGVRPAWA
jgi:hypothetical protein